jgi:hypothetical protein
VPENLVVRQERNLSHSTKMSESEPINPPKPAVNHKDRNFSVCLSGGGVRSAAFNLGVLSKLFATDPNNYRYLSTVSGGGYLGSSFISHAGHSGAIAETAEQMLKFPQPHPTTLPSLLLLLGGGSISIFWNITVIVLIVLLWMLMATVFYAPLVLDCLETGSIEPLGSWLITQNEIIFIIFIALSVFALCVLCTGFCSSKLPSWLQNVLLEIRIIIPAFVLMWMVFSFSFILVLLAIGFGIWYGDIAGKLNLFTFLNISAFISISGVSTFVILYKSFFPVAIGKVLWAFQNFGLKRSAIGALIVLPLAVIAAILLVLSKILLWSITTIGCRTANQSNQFPQACGDHIETVLPITIKLFYISVGILALVFWVITPWIGRILHWIYKSNLSNAWHNSNYKDEKDISVNAPILLVSNFNLYNLSHSIFSQLFVDQYYSLWGV